MSNSSEPYETAFEFRAARGGDQVGGLVRYEPNETAIEKAEGRHSEKNEGASDAPESGLKKKKFSPKDMKKIRKIKKMSFRPG